MSNTDRNAAPPPGNLFALLMSLINRLPQWLSIPFSIVILAILAYWGATSEATKLAHYQKIFGSDTTIGTSLFPSVEYEIAEYTIELDNGGNADWLLNFQFRRLRKEAVYLADMIASSGAKEPLIISDTHGKLQIIKDPYNPPGHATLNRYVVKLDISDATLDQPTSAKIRYRTFENFRGSTSEWAGILALQTTRKAIVKIKFTPEKIGREFRFSTNPFSAPKNTTIIKNPKAEFITAERTLVWEIENPRLNYAYGVEWQW